MRAALTLVLLWAACAPAAEPLDHAELSQAAVTQAPRAPASRQDTVVQTRAGDVRGLRSGDTREFLGIPYAEPPIGALRFAAPRPAAPWATIRDATRFGDSCMQVEGVASAAAMSEDCLTLNVFAPKSKADGPLPVMVFIHGGAFLAGGSFSYDAKALREAGNMVIVTLNYRLGAFGFLAHRTLCAPDEPCTNQGLRDQQLALTWVRDNIAEFGGDPHNVTLFGESAGSVSACAHMFAKGSEGLAQHFILQSGACAYGPLALQSEQLASAAGQALIDALCPDAAEPISCLRDAPATDLTEVLIETVDPIVDGYWPWIDRALFDAPLDQLLERGAVAPGSVIVGTNQNEWLLWEALGATPAPNHNIALRAEIDRFFPTHAEQVAEQYMPDTSLWAGDAFLRLMTDAYFRCPSRALARGLVARANPTYLYEFAVQPAAHALEVDYVFDLLAVSLLFPFQAPVPLLPGVVRAMQGYWTQLAATGVPRHPDLPDWPPYAAAHERMVFRQPVSVRGESADPACDMWDSL